MLKNAYFYEKKYKNRLSAEGGWGLSPQTLRVVAPAYCYNFVESVSSVNTFYYPEKTEGKTTANVLLLLLLHLFLLQTL